MLKKEKIYKVELARRLGNPDNLVGGLIWEAEWIDITEYFHERLDTVNTSLDDQTLQGKLEQSSTSFRFDNVTGKFNPESTENSFWEDSGYIYHSRIRYWEYYADEDIEAQGKYPVLDGLIAEEPKYRAGMLCDIRVNSKLDILREHYLFDELVGRVKTSSSTSLVQIAIKLFDDTYSELGVTTTGGFFRKELLYDDVTTYSRDLLQAINTAVTDGGGIGGLTRENELFFTYFGATAIERANFEDDANCIGLWLFDSTDYNGGAGTTVADQTGDGHTLTVLSGASWWKEGYFEYASRQFYRVLSSEFTGLTDYTLEILFELDNSRLLEKTAGDFRNAAVVGDLLLCPIWVWCDYNVANYEIGDLVGAPNYEFEGFFLNEKNELVYNNGYFTVSGVNFVKTINASIVLGTLLGENQHQYLAITLDYSTNEMIVYLQSKEMSYSINTNFGSVSGNDSLRNKIVGTFWGSVQPAVGSFWNLNDNGKGFYNSIKISNNVKSATDIFDQYTKLYGSTFTIGS